MARPSKCRRVCRMPRCREFVSLGGPGDTENGLMLSVEEYETLRLIDHAGMTQEACASQMNASRTTIQSLYASARRKLARFVVEGGRLRIGVDVLICGGIGAGAKNALAEAGIQLYAGACGDADAQVASFLEGNLTYDPDTECHHHDHEDGHHCHGHEGGHGCGGHGSSH